MKKNKIKPHADMDDAALKKYLINYLLNCLDANFKDYIDENDEFISVHKLTADQVLLLEEVNKFNRKLPSKLKIIEQIAKISGFNTQNHKLMGSSENPLSFDFKVNFVGTTDTEK